MMNDPLDRLGQEFGRVPVPDQWDEITARAAGTDLHATAEGARRLRPFWLVGLAAALVALIGGLVLVGSLRSDPPIPGAPPAEPAEPAGDTIACTSRERLSEVVALVGSGVPTFDYEPAEDLHDLGRRVSGVVRATLDSVVRADGRTVLRVSNVNGLASHEFDFFDASDVSELTISGTGWADSATADPLAEPVPFDGVDVVAFVHSLSSAPVFEVDVEGLYAGCGDDSTPALHVLEAVHDLDMNSIGALAAEIDTYWITVPDEPGEDGDADDHVDEPVVSMPDESLPVDDESAAPELASSGCVDELRTGAAIVEDDPAWATFRPLAAEPGLDVALPLAGETADQTVDISVQRVDGGVLIAVNRWMDDAEESVLAVVEHDGALRWRRCIDGSAVRVFAARGAGFAFVQTWDVETGTTEHQMLDLVSGELVAAPDAVDGNYPSGALGGFVVFEVDLEAPADELLAVDLRTTDVMRIPIRDDLRPEVSGLDPVVVDGELVLAMSAGGYPATAAVYTDGEWSQDPAVIDGLFDPYVIASFDDERAFTAYTASGALLWTQSEIHDPGGEGYYASTHPTSGERGPVVLLRGCDEPVDPASGTCAPALYGVDLATGEIVWRRDGPSGVSHVADGLAIVTTDSGYELIGLATGEPVPGAPRWDDRTAFQQECCGAGDYFFVDGDGGVVWTAAFDRISVWYPDGATSGTTSVSLLDGVSGSGSSG